LLLLIALHHQCKYAIKKRQVVHKFLILTLNFDMLLIFLDIVYV
jgi:hypothetical protein